MAEKQKSEFPVTFLIGALIVTLLLGGVYLYTEHTRLTTPSTPPPLPMGAAEQAYAPQLHFSEFKRFRAANFLNQEVTFLAGTVTNNGNRPVREIEVQLEFKDVFGKTVLRDTVRVLGSATPPLAPAVTQQTCRSVTE